MKDNILLFLLALLASSLLSAQTQLGGDIDGEGALNASGWSVSLNAAGDRLAVGAYNNDGTGASAGHVRVYAFNDTVWQQLGEDIDGEAAEDKSGWSVSLNAVGDRLAVGAPHNDGSRFDAGHVRVYAFDGTAWQQLGADIDGEAREDISGRSVSLNAAGDRLAVGAEYNDGTGYAAGHVRIYAFDGTDWLQLGADIDGEAAGDGSGHSVSLNAAGDRVAVGAPYNDETGVEAGHVRVYAFDGRSWHQLGADIDGEAAADNSGSSVSLNAVGDRLAVGAEWNDGSGQGAGHVRVYAFDGAGWQQVGRDIDGEGALDLSGGSVSLNSAGDRLAVGASEHVAGAESGYVRIYTFNGTAWQQLGSDIEGEAINDEIGRSVSLNASGDRLAAGAPFNDGNGRWAGHVRVFDLSGVVSVKVVENAGGPLSAFPNPSATGQITLAGESLDGARVSVYDALGRVVYTQVLATVAQATLELGGLSAGTYQVDVERQDSRRSRVTVVLE